MVHGTFWRGPWSSLPPRRAVRAQRGYATTARLRHEGEGISRRVRSASRALNMLNLAWVPAVLPATDAAGAAMTTLKEWRGNDEIDGAAQHRKTKTCSTDEVRPRPTVSMRRLKPRAGPCSAAPQLWRLQDFTRVRLTPPS